jgi:tRNA(Ile2) C34 agmatinyltransferase TiaS
LEYSYYNIKFQDTYFLSIEDRNNTVSNNNTWAIREQDRSRIMSAEMKFMGRKAKHTWQDFKTNNDILSELKMNPAVKKIQNYRNK